MTLTGTPHFTLAEVATHTEWPIPSVYQSNAQDTLAALETLRAAVGDGRLRLTSLWRSADQNAGLAGSAANSRHLTAQAVDFVPLDTTLHGFARDFAAAQAAGRVAPFDQLLVEPDHIHYDPGGWYGYRQEALVGSPAVGWQALGAWLGEHPVASGVAASAGFPAARPAAAPDARAGDP